MASFEAQDTSSTYDGSATDIFELSIRVFVLRAQLLSCESSAVACLSCFVPLALVPWSTTLRETPPFLVPQVTAARVLPLYCHC
jgi:hypothetical protein